MTKPACNRCIHWLANHDLDDHSGRYGYCKAPVPIWAAESLGNMHPSGPCTFDSRLVDSLGCGTYQQDPRVHVVKVSA